MKKSALRAFLACTQKKTVGGKQMKTSRDEKRKTNESKQKSLGKLHPAKKTKPRSPALTGQLRLQQHTLQALIADLEESESNEVVCNIAAWSNFDKHGDQYITVELSPRFKLRTERRNANI
jgi:hypothetical protein